MSLSLVGVGYSLVLTVLGRLCRVTDTPAEKNDMHRNEGSYSPTHNKRQ